MIKNYINKNTTLSSKVLDVNKIIMMEDVDMGIKKYANRGFKERKEVLQELTEALEFHSLKKGVQYKELQPRLIELVYMPNDWEERYYKLINVINKYKIRPECDMKIRTVEQMADVKLKSQMSVSKAIADVADLYLDGVITFVEVQFFAEEMINNYPQYIYVDQETNIMARNVFKTIGKKRLKLITEATGFEFNNESIDQERKKHYRKILSRENKAIN